MKRRISLVLPKDLVGRLDRLTNINLSRSALIELILQDFLERRTQNERSQSSAAAINQHAPSLNAEMKDVLSFQIRLTADTESSANP